MRLANHLSATLLLLFIGAATFSDANPVVRFHRIDRFLRSHDESLFDDEDVTGSQTSPAIPRDRAIPELDIDEDIRHNDDRDSVRRRRRVIGVAPPAILLPDESEIVSSEESEQSGRRRRELRKEESEHEEKVVVGGTPPPYLPAPAEDDLDPLLMRRRRQSPLRKGDTGRRSESEDDDSDEGVHRLPRHVDRRQKRLRKSLSRREIRCTDGSCSQESSESRSNEMNSLDPEETTDRPLVRRYRDHDSSSDEDRTGEDLDKQINANDEGALRMSHRAEKEIVAAKSVEQEVDTAVQFGPEEVNNGEGEENAGTNDEGALRMPRRAEKEIVAAKSVEQEVDTAVQVGPEEVNNGEGEENAVLLRRRRRHHYRRFHRLHQKQLQKQRRHTRGLHSFALPGKKGMPAVTDEEGWWVAAEEAKRNNHRILG